MAKKLTDQDFCEAAKELNCEVSAIRAVAEVESKGAGFYPDGFPVILFERHKFRKLTKGRFDADYPEISNAKPGGYGKPGANQRRKFNLAMSLAPEAAMMSCSWGKFQIMGFNYAACGFDSIHSFVDAMKKSEGEQLKTFCGFVETNKLDDDLRRKDWAGFALGYNGKNYKVNKYDQKMSAAYKKFKGESIDCDKLLEIPAEENAPVNPEPHESSLNERSDNPQKSFQSPEQNQGTEQSVTKTEQNPDAKTETAVIVKNEQDVNATEKVNNPQPYNEVGFWQTIKSDLLKVFGANATVQTVAEYGQQAQQYVPASLLIKLAYVVAFVSIAYLLFRVIHFAIDSWKKNQRTKLEAQINTDITRKNMEWS